MLLYHTAPYHAIPELTTPNHTIAYHTVPCYTIMLVFEEFLYKLIVCDGQSQYMSFQSNTYTALPFYVNKFFFLLYFTPLCFQRLSHSIMNWVFGEFRLLSKLRTFNILSSNFSCFLIN